MGKAALRPTGAVAVSEIAAGHTSGPAPSRWSTRGSARGRAILATATPTAPTALPATAALPAAALPPTAALPATAPTTTLTTSLTTSLTTPTIATAALPGPSAAAFPIWLGLAAHGLDLLARECATWTQTAQAVPALRAVVGRTLWGFELGYKACFEVSGSKPVTRVETAVRG